MKMNDAWFFVGVLVFIFIIWIAVGGPLRTPSLSVPTVKQGALGGETYIRLPRAPYDIGNSSTVLVGSSDGGSYYGSSGDSGPLPVSLEGVLIGTPSPYRGAVSMSHYVINASSSNFGTEYVQLAVAQNAGAPVDITGWRLVSEVTGKAAIVPRGTVVPTSGIVNQVQNIVLLPGERAFIVSGLSPVGTSFRENKCVGYLSTFQQFSPSLPQNCPVPRDELAAFYGAYYVRDSTCVEYVNTLPRCETVLFPPKTLSKECRNFTTQHFNYNACVSAHRNDTNFNGTVWHLYLGRDKHMWRAKYEIVKLLDASGKTVDAFSY